MTEPALDTVPSSASPKRQVHPRLRPAPTPKRRLWGDRVARWVVSAGGVAIVASILGILIFILAEIWPIFFKPRVEPERTAEVAHAALTAALTDEHRGLVAAITADGRVVAVRAESGALEAERPIASPQVVVTAASSPPGGRALTAALADGRVAIVPVAFDVTFEGPDGSQRRTSPRFDPPILLDMDAAGRPLRAFAAQLGEDGSAVGAAQLADGTLVVVRRSVETNGITGETSESVDRSESKLDRSLKTLVFDEEQKNLWGGTAEGSLLWWRLEAAQPGTAGISSAGRSEITALSPLIGGRSLAVGQADGSLSVWFPVEEGDGVARLTRVRDFPDLPSAVRHLAPSGRGKGFLAADESGQVGLYWSTSERTLWTGRGPFERPTGLAFSPKADGAVLTAGSKVAELAVFNPHPEISWKALFGKIWYEGYGEPEYSWQSSSGTDDFEPKLSLVPLLIGTLKGTFYSMLLAIPLGVFGAMFISQFMHPAYKRVLKPVIEIMASLPSVVLGFLAGLWLAPRVEKVVPGLFLMLLVLPVVVLIAGGIWHSMPRKIRNRFRSGSETVLYVGALLVGLGLCFALSKPFENLVFDGNFQTWLQATTDWTYDQRNAIIVGLAMGFAVIPIIFAISEDAFTNVPQNLVAGSLALGANRWQTVTRVVLPTASPGIFSAIMIGFGRAVGETMIVLMATGNTPILEWNPFNGFRTLSANIAVEIPEAAQGGTLYRTLFLAALLLFGITFLVNTVAEVVRQRLRERYSQL